MPSTLDIHTGHGPLAASISNGMVSLLHHYTGRGPVRARTTIDDNLIVCVLATTLTKSEQHLVECGRHYVVLRGRRAIHGVLAGDAISLVEELTDRDVVAFTSTTTSTPTSPSRPSSSHQSPIADRRRDDVSTKGSLVDLSMGTR